MEIWRDIVGYEGYQVSNLGRVRRLHKTVPPRVLKLGNPGNGYLQATLFRDGKPKHLLVHRLVAQAFVPNPDGKPQVNHIDGDKANNHASNLEWATSFENMRHAVATGLFKSGEDHYGARFTNEQVRYIRDNPDDLTQRQLAAVFGVKPQTISQIQLGKVYLCAGGAIRTEKLPDPQRVSDEARDEIRRLYVRGSHEFNSVALAKKYGVTHRTILNIIHET